MLNLELWNTQRKKLKLTLADIAEQSQVSISTIKDIFRGATTDPRLETVQAIERTLGLAPQWTEEELTQGVGRHPIVLSDEDSYLINLFAQAEEVLGEAYVKAIKTAVEIAIQQKRK